MFEIKQSFNLKGEIKISGSKNASLPIIAANQILDNQIKLNNVPNIKDINTLQTIIEKDLSRGHLNGKLSSQIRSSILLIPAGLIKYGKIDFSNPGGCNIGKRPLDTFDYALEQAGVKVNYKEHYKEYKIYKKPKKHIILPEFSVTATESLITYLAFLPNIDYEITVSQIAIEPHVINLIEFLQNAGAKIKINYDHSLVIKPTKINIKNFSFNIVGDYIEVGTYFAVGAVADNSEIVLKGINPEHLKAVFVIADKIGINYKIGENYILVNSFNKKNYKSCKLQTMIYPGFPTDLQPIFGVLLTQSKGISKIFETLFEGRFSYLTELENMGAKVEILNPHQAIIIGPTQLEGTYVATKDLRAGGALLVAGTIANNKTYITNENIIERGYENVVEKLKGVGVNIEKISYKLNDS